jgi:4-amino-4-deoxy-L-arabinose transferase-like glycosyltransferase
MQLAGEGGFYSAQFEKREPLFILMVKLFFTLFGVSATHLRFASCTFSLSVVYLTYRLGKEWFSGAVGLIAAFIMAVHPYLIMLSARGLREEWFCVLLLLFVYFSYVTSFRSAWARVAVSGLIAGCIVLTRSEFFPVLAIVLFLYPLLARLHWNYAMAAASLVLCISIGVPHQYSMYKKYGDVFFTANQYARFYANREFAGQPGFPSDEDIMLKGMYYGPKISPVDYYCKYHTPWQLVYGSIIGYARIHLQMPFAFVSGRGNAQTVIHEANAIKNNPGAEAVMNVIRLAAKLFKDRWMSNLMGIAVFLTFIAGLVLIGVCRHWMLYVYLIAFQAHTSFLAFLGLDERLTVHSYPLIALCCGFCVFSLFGNRSDQNLSARMRAEKV